MSMKLRWRNAFVAERAQRSEAMRGERRRLNAGAFSYEGATGGSMLVAGKE